jgi:phage terminase large subunit
LSEPLTAHALAEWREKPEKFVWDQFGVDPDQWQLQALRELGNPDVAKRRVAMQACAGPGKSTVLAWFGWNFMTCYGRANEHPKGAAVSITGENLKLNLWAELAKWRLRSPLLQRLFEQTNAAIFSRTHPDTWQLSARSYPKKANADELGATLSGLHSEYVLYLIDESGGVPPAIGRAAEQGLSNCKVGVIAQAGNPMSLESLLYESVTKLRAQWSVVRITGDPDDSARSPRIDVTWAREQIALYGRENPWVKIYILGMFPPSSVNALIGPDECDAATKRIYREDQYTYMPPVLGVDCARFGDDSTALVKRQGLVCFPFQVMRNAKTQEIGGRIIRTKVDDGIEAVFIDNAMAGGVIDYCELLGHTLTGVDFGGAALEPKRYYNRRAEMAVTATDYIKSGGHIPNDPEFIAELCAHTYTFKDGLFLIEPKDLVKKKIGRSPDKFDAYILTHAMPVAISPSLENQHRYPGMSANAGQAKTEYDPWSRS